MSKKTHDAFSENIFPDSLPVKLQFHSLGFQDTNFGAACYGLNCFLQKFVCWHPNPQCDSIWEIKLLGGEGLDEVMRMEPLWWDQCPYKKRKRCQGFLSPSSEKGAINKPGRGPSSRTESAGTLVLDFSASRMLRNKYLLFKPPNLWYFVIAPWADWDRSLKFTSLELISLGWKSTAFLTFSWTHIMKSSCVPLC